MPVPEGSGPVRVLLAEDEEHLGTILETFLAGRGYLVTRVHDGAAAVRELRASTFDVTLLDIVMPELDGLEVLRTLSTAPVPPEAIVMTGNGTVETALTAIRLGAYDYLAKPYRMAEVELLVARAAAKRRLRLAAARVRWSAGSRAPVFLTRDAGMRSILDRAAGEARAATAGMSPWLVAGLPGSGRRALARWLHANACDDAPAEPLSIVLGGDRDADVAALFGRPDVAGDGGIGALEAAAGCTLIVDAWSETDPEVRALLGAAVGAGVFARGALPGGCLVPLTARLVICAASGDPFPPEFESGTLRVELPPLDARPMDIPLLADHLLRVASGGRVVLGDDVRSALGAGLWSWRGGAAELRDAVRAAGWRAWNRAGAEGGGAPVVVGLRDLEVESRIPGEGADLSDERRE